MGRAIAVWVLAGCCAVRAESTAKQAAPSYSVASVVHSVSFAPGFFAPYTPVTIFGSDLAFSTAELAPGQAQLPVELGGVSVTVTGLRVPLLYVSEKQINFLIPAGMLEGEATLRVSRLGVLGPDVSIRIGSAAPALFRTASDFAIATHADGSLITREAPAVAGEVIVLYAAGLGLTLQEPPPQAVPASASQLVRLAELRVLLDGAPLDASRILYAGLTPMSAGLYQVNLRLPDRVGPDPEVRVSIGGQSSAPGIKLPVR